MKSWVLNWRPWVFWFLTWIESNMFDELNNTWGDFILLELMTLYLLLVQNWFFCLSLAIYSGFRKKYFTLKALIVFRNIRSSNLLSSTPQVPLPWNSSSNLPCFQASQFLPLKSLSESHKYQAHTALFMQMLNWHSRVLWLFIREIWIWVFNTRTFI